MKFTPILFIFALLSQSCSTRYPRVKISGDRLRDYTSKSRSFMVSAEANKSTICGNKIYKAGGNIIDAAIASSFAISVEKPHSTGLGGGGFLIYYDKTNQENYVYDFREMAPLNGHSKMFLDDQGNEIKNSSVNGIKAVGVPGLVKGLKTIHEKHGKLPWGQLLDCAIKIAGEGFEVYDELAQAINNKKDLLQKYNGNSIFFRSDGEPLQKGDLLVQKDLAETLERIKQTGAKDFYEGEIAKKIVATNKKYNGLITLEDLKNYQVKEREPIIGKYKGYQVISMPPPSSGGTHVIQILNILENFKLDDYPLTVKNIHLTSSAMQMAFADRAKYMGDSDFVTIPLEQIVSKQYAKNLSQKIHAKKSLRQSNFPLSPQEFKESTETSHLSFMDAKGNTVVTTQTINGWFGSKVIATGTGIMLNNEMDDFATKVGASNIYGAIGGENNLVRAKARPLSSMTPSIVLKDKMPVLAVGSPNGTRIISCVLLTILNTIEYKMNLSDAISLTRYHHQWHPDFIRVDSPGLDKGTISGLNRLGHQVKYEPYNCRVQAISLTEGVLTGVSDPRARGLSLGL